ncbi:MAG: PAS domain-containing protein, partial [Leptolyngbyaceae cyanobacterium SL_7_1]|nr:PAS domain-containing protein [Leptolyngbyaceae cyanobacterium SL_7_1]
ANTSQNIQSLSRQAAEQLRLLNVNQTGVRMFGAQTKAELLPSVRQIFVPETQEAFIGELLAIANEEPFFAAETVLQTLQGDRFSVWFTITFPPISQAYDHILVSLLDISEIKQAEASVRESEERLRLALTAANQGLYDLNVQTGEAIVTPEYAQMLGYDPDEFQETNARWRQRLHPDDAADVYQVYTDYMTGKRDDYRVEFRQRCKTGDWRWILSVGKVVAWGDDHQPLRMLGTHTDITDRKRSEAALRESEERYRYLAELIPQLVWTASPEGMMLDVNQRWIEYTGMTLPEIQQLGWQSIIHPDDITTLYQHWETAQHQGTDYQAEGRMRRNDGVYRWHLHQALPQRNQQGQVLQWFGTATDIDDQKQLEQQRDRVLQQEQAARTEAERANRIKDEFLAVLSHELRSPLNPILGWATLLQSRSLDEQTTQRALATIERNAKLQTQLIEDLLDVSRILRGKLVLNTTVVDPASLIDAALETVKLAADAKGIQIQKRFTPIPGHIIGDVARLQQILWNLLSNAIKFTPPGGRVEVKLESSQCTASKSELGALPYSSQHFAQITVSDTGKGISPTFLPHVFEYFRQEDGTTTRKFGGLGLGLAIVRHLTELHGGVVWAESPGEEQGATFTVSLPLKPISILPVLDHPGDDPTIHLANIKILVVDDEPDIREVVSFILQQAGATVRVAVSATEALECFQQSPPDCLVCDIGMPEIDGYQLMRQIRCLSIKQGGRIPAIALTAYAGEIDQQQAIAAGFQRHLAKPVEPEELVKAVAHLIKHLIKHSNP